MRKSRREAGRRRGLSVLTLATGIAAVIVLAVFFVSQSQPPKVSPSARGTVATQPAATPTASAPTVAAEPQIAAVGPSSPVAISIPAINVNSSIIKIGKDNDGQLKAPEGKDINKVAWYKDSATPGEIGASVLEGHIDTVNGPSVFYRLAAVRIGNKITVKREDGKTAEYTVSAVRSYPDKAQFPTELVYGGDLSAPTLRVITCANFNQTTRHYAGNTVVFAKFDNVK